MKRQPNPESDLDFHRAVSADAGRRIVEKQESDFNHWGSRILSQLRPILTEDRVPGTGRTFCEQFEVAWCRWSATERGVFFGGRLAAGAIDLPAESL